MNGREGQESGLWLMATVAPGAELPRNAWGTIGRLSAHASS